MPTLKTEELYEKLTEIVAYGLVGMKSIIDHKDPMETYMPPTREQVVNTCMQSNMIYAQLKTMVAAIIHAVNELDEGEYHIEYVSQDIVKLTKI